MCGFRGFRRRCPTRDLGTGEEADSVRGAIRGPRVEMRGLVDEAELERELSRATVGLVTQRDDITEFNIPSTTDDLHGARYPGDRKRQHKLRGRTNRAAFGRWLGDESPRLFMARSRPRSPTRRARSARRRGSALRRPVVSAGSMCAKFEELLAGVVDGRRRPRDAPPER